MQSVRFWPVLMLQYGIQFIPLAVPSSAARVALEIRFFQRVGVLGAGHLDRVDRQLQEFVVQLLLIMVILVSAWSSLTLLVEPGFARRCPAPSTGMAARSRRAPRGARRSISPSSVPKTEDADRILEGPARDGSRRRIPCGCSGIRGSRDVFGGNLTPKCSRHDPGACLLRSGTTSPWRADPGEHLREHVRGLHAGAGRDGGRRGRIHRGLVALGVPNAAAISTAIAFRLVTFYLPPIWGGFAMRWISQHDYV